MSDGSQTVPTVAPLSKGQVFVRRLISSIVLWTVVISALFSGYRWLADGVFLAIMLLLAGFGLYEFYGLVEKRGLGCFRGWGMVGGLLLMGCTFVYLSGVGWLKAGDANDFETAFLILFVLGLCVRQLAAKDNSAGLTTIAMTLMGLMYVPWLLNFIQKINYYPGMDGRHYVLYFILVTKFSDIGAYCTGSLFGRHKMCPSISPGKTWEGFGGAVLFSVGISLGYAQFAGPRLPGMAVGHAVALGMIFSATAVVGDLIESRFKREAGLKDSGRWFPGIGGILDLLDSLLFNAPLMYLYMRYIMRPELLTLG